MASQTSSPVSYKSTHSSRSSVLERAREYNRRIEDQKHGNIMFGTSSLSPHNHNKNQFYNNDDRRRSKSLERGSVDPFGVSVSNNSSTGYNNNNINQYNSGSTTSSNYHQQQQQRSHSAGRPSQYYPIQQQSTNITTDVNTTATHSSPTRNRAIASVNNTNNTKKLQPPSATSSAYNNTNNNSSNYRPLGIVPQEQSTTTNTMTKTPTKTSSRQDPQSYNNHNHMSHTTTTPTTATTTTQSSNHHHQQQQHNQRNRNTDHHDHNNKVRLPTDEKKEELYPSNNNNNTQQQQQHEPTTSGWNNQNNNQNNNTGPVVTPELLVDALSGHEDGLLAIAEKLMEHYDSGYDVMGEAIIDAFADVQKLFQHVVEAAHMEGAAFEAARREDEEKQRARDGQLDNSIVTSSDNRLPISPSSPTKGGPTRHDEFIDQDVKDVLAEAIRHGTTLRAERKDSQCYHLFASACQDASSLLPVDSDHRGRLQLSIARAESMSPDRACAILRYAMDDVLRSGLRAHHPTPIPDPSTRADVVLNRNISSSTGNNAIVQQSPDEALASLMEELKEILQAPIYHDTPLQHVASRFWNALSESQKIQHRNEARLEQNLGKLKGEFLLARAEWEEKLSQSNAATEKYKSKYEDLLVKAQKEGFVERSFATTTNTATNDDTNSVHYNNIDLSSVYGSVKSAASKAETVASGVSGFAQHARSLVMNSGFNCVAPTNTENDTRNNRNNEGGDDDDGMLDSNDDDAEFDSNPLPQSNIVRGRSTRSRSRTKRNNSNSQQQSASTSQNHRFQEYSRSPHRVDI